ncbi:hypothetical protein LQL77_30730 [Rhodococcus cerastii]|nr:hypothetical protein [Rhodococcus cerastii]
MVPPRTFHPGDDRALEYFELVLPTNPTLDITDNYTQAHMFRTLLDSGHIPGHHSLTLYCASTLHDAHQA